MLLGTDAVPIIIVLTPINRMCGVDGSYKFLVNIVIAVSKMKLICAHTQVETNTVELRFKQPVGFYDSL